MRCLPIYECKVNILKMKKKPKIMEISKVEEVEEDIISMISKWFHDVHCNLGKRIYLKILITIQTHLFIYFIIIT